MADFEIASQNAVRHGFPWDAFSILANVFGGKCRNFIWQTNIHVHVKMLLALSCVPSVDVTNAFEMLVESCPREVDPVLDYWEINYIIRKGQNFRVESRFAFGNTETLDYPRGIVGHRECPQVIA